MIKSDTWMPLYVADYLADTAHLTTTQHGAYFLLILAAWKRGGTLPNDDSQLRTICRMSAKEWKNSADILRAFFKPHLGLQLIHTRIEEEFLKAQDISDKRRKAGKMGGRPRTNSESFDKAKAIQNETPSPSPSEDKESSGEVIALSGDFDKDAWTAAVRLLRDQGGMQEKSARAFFGKLVSVNGLQPKDILPSITAALTTATLDPQGYLTKAARGIARKRWDEPSKRVGFV